LNHTYCFTITYKEDDLTKTSVLYLRVGEILSENYFGLNLGYGVFPQLGEISPMVGISFHPAQKQYTKGVKIRNEWLYNFNFFFGTNIDSDPLSLGEGIDSDVVKRQRLWLFGLGYRFGDIDPNAGLVLFERSDSHHLEATYYFSLVFNIDFIRYIKPGFEQLTKKPE